MKQHAHLAKDLYTLRDEKLLALLEEVRVACGSWKNVVRQARISTRYLRKIRNRPHTVVSLYLMERILLRTGFPHRINELEWYTVDQLVEMGVWKPTRGWKENVERARRRNVDFNGAEEAQGKNVDLKNRQKNRHSTASRPSHSKGKNEDF
jgi:hypothetical protein